MPVVVIRWALVAALVVGVVAKVGAQSATYAVKQDVPAGHMNMRSGPGKDHDIIAEIPAGTAGLVGIGPCLAPDDGVLQNPFCPVMWDGKTGWVSSTGLETAMSGSATLSLTPDQPAPPAAPPTLAATPSAPTDVCRARCDFDYETTLQMLAEQEASLPRGLRFSSEAARRAAKEALPYCYRQCLRP